MLPAVHRLRRSGDFSHALRSGRRAGTRLVVVHLAAPADRAHHAQHAQPSSRVGADPVQIGFVVSKAVGSAVVRNRVKRQLRHQLRDRLSQLRPGAVYVVRANPAAAEATSADLGRDIDRCLAKLEADRS